MTIIRRDEEHRLVEWELRDVVTVLLLKKVSVQDDPLSAYDKQRNKRLALMLRDSRQQLAAATRQPSAAWGRIQVLGTSNPAVAWSRSSGRLRRYFGGDQLLNLIYNETMCRAYALDLRVYHEKSDEGDTSQGLGRETER